MFRSVVIVLALVPILCACIVSTSPALAVKAVPPGSPASVALCLCDLRHAGFYQTWGRFFTDQREARSDHVSLRSLHSHGWMSAFDSAFVRAGRSGMLAVYDAVNSYRTAAGADWEYRAALASLQRDQVFYHHLHSIPTGDVGEERLGYVFTAEFDQIPVTATVTLFRRRDYVAKLVVIGGLDNFLPGQAVLLAQVIDRRMLNAK